MREILKNINEQQRREFYIKKNYVNLYNDIINFKNNIDVSYVDYKNFTELIFRYYNNYTLIPTCDNCNKNVKFRGFNIGYNNYCSKKCVMLDKKVVEKRNTKSKLTNLKKYGVTNYAKTEECKNKILKTNNEKYGTDYYTQTDEFKKKSIKTNNEKYGVDYYTQTDEFKEKSVKTNNKRYGVDHHTKSKEYLNKVRASNNKKYGTDYYTQTDEFRKKSTETNNKKYGSSHHMKYKKEKGILKLQSKEKEFELYDNYKNYLKLVKISKGELIYKSEKCGHEFSINKQLLYLRNKKNMKICTICNSKDSCNTSYYESEIHEFLHDNNINFRKNEKNIIPPLEIDIYIPEYKVGIEFNGLYWHSDLYKDSKYHYDKTINCNNKNIQLIHVWEDDWIYKKDILKSMILNKLGKTEKKIYARKCDIRLVSNIEKKLFLDNNHLQGNSNSSINIGLYYEGSLVSIMTFGKLRKNLGNVSKKGYFELIRYCNVLNSNVVGGASKLLNYFKKNYYFESIITYSKNDYSDGNLYKKLGFSYIHETGCGYTYVGSSKIRENRYKFNKHTLIKEGFDSNKSEKEIMVDRGYYRVYDSGNKKWELNK